MRAVYKARHDVLLEELKAFRRICRVSGEHAGVHLLLTFTDGRDEAEAIRQAAQQGVRVYGLSRYYVGDATGKASATVILGYANLTEEALREVQQMLGVTPEETMAFGDNCNDIGMLQRAGESYAVANAHPEVKKTVKYIAPANTEDGVLQTVKERLLGGIK